MAALRKFLFENSFDDDVAEEDFAAEAELGETDEPAVEEPPPPTYSEADLKAARDEAFAAGHEEGLRSAGDTIEQRTSAILAAIAENLGQLFHAQAEAAERSARDAAAVAVAVTRKVLPALAERGAVEEVERLVTEAMELVRDEPRVTIHVNEELRDALAERMESMTVRYGFDGQIVLSTEAGLAPSDCRVDWAGGGAARDTAALWREIDAIVSRNLGHTDSDESPAAGSGDGEPPAAGTREPS